MKKNLSLSLLLLLFLACSKNADAVITVPPVEQPANFAKGADISWITQQEAAGVKFYNSDGTQDDIFAILKKKGINSIRLRVWVNPKDGWNNTADVVAKAKRAKAADMKILIDFHYSDSWADPGKQTKPAAWNSLSFADLKTALATHTTEVMNQLKTNGITPEWVQIGNETNDGMLWPDGRATTNMANYAALVSAGYEAVKTVSATSLVIAHVSNGYDTNLFKWNIGGLIANNAKFDIIGISLYPSASDWSTKNQQCLNTMTEMISTYNKKVMVVEVGMPANDPANCKSFLADLIAKTKAIPKEKGLGVFYWEPQCYKNWQGYSLGAFDDTGKPSAAMDAFLN